MLNISHKKLFISFGIFSLTLFLLYQINVKLNKNEKVKAEIKFLPDLKIKSFNDIDYNVNNLDGKKLLIIYFDPTCDFCQDKAKEFYEYKDSIFNFNIFMITSNKDLSKTISFYNTYNLSEIKSLKLAVDSTNMFSNTFNTFKIPSYFFYDEKHKLIKIVNGSVLIQTLLSILKT